MDFIPQQDGQFSEWSANFESGIDTEFATYGLTSGQATAYTALDTAFQAAYALAINPATRTPVTVAAKDSAKTAAIANARLLARVVNAFPSVTNSMRLTLGLTPRSGTLTPIPAPTTKPLPIVLGYNPLGHVLQIRDESTPDSRAKPAGVISCQVWGKIGPTAPASLEECEFLGIYTKPFLSLTFPAAAAGQKMYYLTRWQTRRGDVGPLSDMISPTVPAA